MMEILNIAPSAFRDSPMQGLCQSLVLRKSLKLLELKLGC